MYISLLHVMIHIYIYRHRRVRGMLHIYLAISILAECFYCDSNVSIVTLMFLF